MTVPAALDEVAGRLVCPHCRAVSLRRTGTSLGCPDGHRFDIARQGYVSLLAGRRPVPGDDTAMVAARERFLAADHYRPLRTAIAEVAVAHAAPGLAVDLAGGTGHYLAAVVEAGAAPWGLTIDVSTAALRRAARAHPRLAAVAADVRAPLPVATGSAGVVLSVFGPRDVGEIERVLGPGGVLIVAGAAPDHLRELRGPVGTIGVDPRRPERLDAALRSFTVLDRRTLTWELRLARDDVHAVVAMGPSAHHVEPAFLRDRVAALPEVVEVTAAVDLRVLHR